MPNIVKKEFLNDLEKRFGQFKKLPKSLSLFELEEANVRIYIRYSKIHPRNQTFYGLRQEDLKKLEGGNSIICFLWENQKQPLFIPYGDYEEIFAQVSPASDGQYKVQIYIDKESSELYIANAGRFNIEAFYGWNILESVIDKSKVTKVPDLSHSQVQTLVGSIGSLKGFDVWIPPYDRNKLDKNIITELEVRDRLPDRYSGIYNIIIPILIYYPFGGLQIYVTPVVTNDKVLVGMRKKCGTWRQTQPLTVDVIKDPQKKYTIRASEIGVCQLTDPESLCLLTNVRK
ncbi:MAG: hypothetical protein IIC76_12865 [Bacteroidetes bacterium]|nr:hypothetical protein [Bacteroidota bacterium]